MTPHAVLQTRPSSGWPRSPRRRSPTSRCETAARSAARSPTATRPPTCRRCSSPRRAASRRRARTGSARSRPSTCSRTPHGRRSRPDEVITEVRLPAFDGWGHGHRKFARRAEDWAMVGVAALIKVSDGRSRTSDRAHQHGLGPRARDRRGAGAARAAGQRRGDRRRGEPGGRQHRPAGRSQRHAGLQAPSRPRAHAARAGGGRRDRSIERNVDRRRIVLAAGEGRRFGGPSRWPASRASRCSATRSRRCAARGGARSRRRRARGARGPGARRRGPARTRWSTAATGRRARRRRCAAAWRPRATSTPCSSPLATSRVSPPR